MEPLDWALLTEQCAGDEDLVRDVVALYRRDQATLLGDVQRALDAGDLLAGKRSAHRLKGALLSLAATPAADLAMQVERAAEAGDAAGARDALSRLEAELARLAAALG